MFDQEKDEWAKFFDFYKKKFGEEVGVMPSIYEDEKLEIDLILGEDTEKLRGIRVLKYVEVDESELEDEDDEEEEVEIEEDEEDEDENDDEEDDDQMVAVDVYDLVQTEGEIKGEAFIELKLGNEEQGEPSGDPEDELPWDKITIFSSNGEVTGDIVCAVAMKGDDLDTAIVFLEDPELDDQ